MKTKASLIVCFCLFSIALVSGCGKEADTVGEPFTDEMQAEIEAAETANSGPV